MYILANFFRAFTEYVSIEQFISKIFQLCASVRALSLGYEKIILYSGKNSHNKSNFWLLLLYVYILKDTITDVYVSEDPNVEFKNLCDSAEKTLIIFPDDASYSGQQIRDQVCQLRNLKINSDIYIAVPYISENAIESIKGAYQTEEKTGCIMIPRESYIFYTFGQNIIKKGRENLVDNYRNTVEFGKPTIYFAHKLADTISIPQNIYIFGVQLNYSKDTRNLKGYFNMSLIKNCRYRDFSDDMLNTLTKDANDDLGMAMCPLPFYKYITYYKPDGRGFNDIGFNQNIQIDNELSFQKEKV
jgi:hypothetical protein